MGRNITVVLVLMAVLTIAIPIGLIYVSRTNIAYNESVLVDGSRPLTGNWDQGAYNFTNTGGWFLGSTLWNGISGKPLIMNTYPNPPWYDSGLVGYWQMNEGYGTTISDDSGNSNTGTINGASWIQGKYNEGLSFDGINDYVTCGNNISLHPDDFTIALWMQLVSHTDSWQGIIGTRDWEDANWFIWTTGAGSNIIIFDVCFADAAHVAYSSPSLSLGTYYFIAMTKSGQTVKYYIDALLKETDTGIGAYSKITSKSLVIGARAGTGSPSNIRADDIRFYNRALSVDELSALYNGQKNSYAGQYWYKTTDNILYQRNLLNSAWINVLTHQTSGWSATTPTFPASTVDVQNTNPFPVALYFLSAGTVDDVTITDQQGIAVTMTFSEPKNVDGLVMVIGPLCKIRMTYSNAPTWKWYGLDIP